MDSPPHWGREYLERKTHEDPTLYSIFSHTLLLHDTPIIQKLTLLKGLEFAISRNSISMTVLALLEMLEEAESQLGLKTLSDTMKHAYAASAVKWTVQHNSSNLEYFQAVKKLWRGRIGRMKLGGRGGLGSEELWAWKDEIEASVWEESLAQSVVKKSESINAVEAIRSYVKEEREKMKMGPSFLELVEKKSVIDDNDDRETPLNKNEDSIPHSPQVNEALKSSSVELQPDAEVQVAKTVSNISRKGDAGIDHASQCNTSNVPRRSLMERTITAHTYEWDESIDGSQEGSSNCGGRVELPRLRKRPVSPLNECETGSSTPRRTIRKWSSLEENTLRIGVEKYGKGNWKAIFTGYQDIFQNRTSVDLKDKWRNLARQKKFKKL